MKLEAIKISKQFAGHTGLKQVSFQISEWQTVAILGPSGSGKSTLLRAIGGLDQIDSGEIHVDGEKIPSEGEALLQYRRKIGTVFQAFNLFPHLTVLQNIELPLHRVHQLPLHEASERAMQFLERFNLREHALKKPAQLSGGQQQRVAIARAAAIKARLLLLDEPTSALDPLMTSEILDLIFEMRAEGIRIVLASHHMGFVRKISDWVVFLDQGELLEYGPTAEFFQKPKSEQAKHFLEKVLKY